MVFNHIHLKNVAAFSDFSWSKHGRINVIVGENDTGKSHLLKMLYVVAKSAEELSKKSVYDKTAWVSTVSEKLDWTFQPASGLGSLVRNGARQMLVEAKLSGEDLQFSVDRARGTISTSAASRGPSQGNALFIPPKEILTSFSAIAVTRESLEIPGFDDTYYDLIKLLRIPPTRGRVNDSLAQVLDALGNLFQGRIVKSRSSDEFTFERGERSFEMPQTADGIKKIGILTTLIKNRSLNTQSILFLDEPETNLHPKAIAIFTRMLFLIGLSGAQVYLATHSYFVIKQMQILAKQYEESVPFCSLRRVGDEIDATISDLREGMPQNPIVEESIRLYQEELEIDMKLRERK